MALIIGSKRWTEKPPLGAQINWGHPLARGLVGCWLLNEGAGSQAINLARPLHGTLANGAGWAPSRLGVAATFDGSDDRITTPVVSGKVLTWIARWNVTTLGTLTYQSLITIPAPNYLLMNLDDASDTASFWSSDGMAGDSLGITNLTAGRWYTTGFVREGDSITNGYKGYLDGVFTGQANTGVWVSTDVLWIGNRADQVQPFGGLMNMNLVYDRVLLPAEFAQHRAEPYAFLLPQSPRLRYFFPSVAAPAPEAVLLGHGPLLSGQRNRVIQRV